jgi:hypothetical protein
MISSLHSDGQQPSNTYNIVPQESMKLIELHSKERVEELIKAVNHHAKFLATSGARLMTEDLFIAAQRAEMEKEIEVLEKAKKKQLRQ